MDSLLLGPQTNGQRMTRNKETCSGLEASVAWDGQSSWNHKKNKNKNAKEKGVAIAAIWYYFRKVISSHNFIIIKCQVRCADSIMEMGTLCDHFGGGFVCD